jgi:protein CpxP
MTLISSNRMIALAVAALLAAPAAALAQTAQTPAQAPSTTSSEAGKTASSGAAARVEQRIKELRAQLKISPAEETQWNQFAQTMRDNARDMDQAVMERGQQFPSMNALQDMQSYEKIAEAHVQHLQKLLPAFQGLYAAMSPEQKHRADEVFRARAESRTQNGSSTPK